MHRHTKVHPFCAILYVVENWKYTLKIGNVAFGGGSKDLKIGTNPSTWDVRQEDSEVPRHPWVHSEFEGYMIPCLKE